MSSNARTFRPGGERGNPRRLRKYVLEVVGAAVVNAKPNSTNARKIVFVAAIVKECECRVASLRANLKGIKTVMYCTCAYTHQPNSEMLRLSQHIICGDIVSSDLQQLNEARELQILFGCFGQSCLGNDCLGCATNCTLQTKLSLEDELVEILFRICRSVNEARICYV